MEYKELFQWNVAASAKNIAEVLSFTRNLSARIVFNLKAGNQEELQQVLHTAFLSDNSFEFWTVLNLDPFENVISEPWLNNYTGLLCHLKYTSLANKKVIGYNTTTRHTTQIISKIQSYLAMQGVINILFIPMQDEVIFDEITILKVNAAAATNDAFYEPIPDKIKRTAYPLQIYVDITDTNKALENINLFTGKLTDRLNASAIDKELLLKIYALKKALDDQDNKNKTLHSTLITNNTYIDFLKSILYDGEEGLDGAAGSFKYSEMIKIKRFYHYEYEVLPLWFKRLGHVVKVLTGKRTFRSLFNDNVKKYKD